MKRETVALEKPTVCQDSPANFIFPSRSRIPEPPLTSERWFLSVCYPKAEEQARRSKAREREERARIIRYWAELTPDEQQRLDAEALTDANPETRAAYEGATTPQVKRLLLVGLRDAVIRRRLGLPPTD